jgi:hypothetical protein
MLQNVNGAVQCIEYPLAQINYAEVWTILLSSWFRISGISSSGAHIVTSVQLNSVTLPLIEPILNQIRPTCQEPTSDPAAECSKFNVLIRSHYKYMSAARNSLRPGDRVIDFVLQPEIHATLFARLLGNYVPTHMMILTTQELILIRDHLAHWWSPQERYGNVFHFVGLRNISNLSLDEHADGLLDLTIHMPGSDRLQRRFHPSMREALEQMVGVHA